MTSQLMQLGYKGEQHDDIARIDTKKIYAWFLDQGEGNRHRIEVVRKTGVPNERAYAALQKLVDEGKIARARCFYSLKK